MSALSLSFPSRPCGLSDDLESFFHVITYLAMRFHESDSSSNPRDLEEAIDILFHRRRRQKNGIYIGGRYKLDHIIIGSYLPSFMPTHSRGLCSLIVDLMKLCNTHYNAIEQEIESRKQATARGDFIQRDIEIDRGKSSTSMGS